jgi:hypothetical protein
MRGRPRKMKNKRWPELTQKVDTADFTMTVGEEVFHPHEGEWVLVRKRISPQAFGVLLRFFPLAKNGINNDNAEAVADLLPQVSDILAAAVLKWNWTGPDNEPYPDPFGHPEVFQKVLSLDEQLYLVTLVNQPTAVPKNLPTPS